MIANTNNSFLARMARRFFNWRLQREIYGGIFPHAGRESNEGYPFADYDDLVKLTEELDLRKMVEEAEHRVSQLPEAYSKCFRYVMRRDINERLAMYIAVAKRRAHPKEIEAPSAVAQTS